MREIIKVKNVSKVYKINKRKSGLFGAVLNLFAPRYEKKIAVSDMNFSIEEGEAVAFIGSNGAGKSTTIKMLSGILYPSEGEIRRIYLQSTKELKMMIERLAPVEVGLMVKTWGNGGFLEVDFKESQAIISNK